MKRIIILLTILFFSIATYAQKGNEKIQALKIAFLTEKLELTSKEAQVFWPLYNEHDKRRKELFKAEKKEWKNRIKEGYNFDDISDEQAEKILRKINECREERHKHKLGFYKKLRELLSPKKILILEIAEREFNKKLMRKFRDKKRI